MNIFFCIKNYCSWSISSCPRVFSLQACPLEFKLFSLSTCACLQSCFSRIWFFVTRWAIAHKPPQSMESSRQEYCSGLPFSSPGDLPDQGIEPRSPALQADSLLSWPPFFYYIPQCFFLVDLCVLYKTLLSILFFCKHPLSIFHPSFIVSLVEQKSLTFMIKTRVSHTRYKKKWPKRKDDQFSCKQEYKYIQ